MKKLLLGLLALASVSAFATELECSISTLQDAQLCMDKVASTHVEYNLPNIGSVSTQKNLLKKVLNALGKEVHPAVAIADYVGVMLEKGDEWYLYYYALKKGKSQQVVSVGDINLVDLNYELTAPLTVSDLILGDKNKKFDADDRGWIQDHLDLE
jgi:ABC-type proline/glycine betaine transport system substrate-binding protein